MNEHRKHLLTTTALPDSIFSDSLSLGSDETKNEYQNAVDKLTSEEKAELRLFVPWFRKTLFEIRHQLEQIPIDFFISTGNFTPKVHVSIQSARVKEIFRKAITEEILRVVAEHNSKFASLSVLASHSARLH
ncbi:hypothetical protein K2X83_01725 [Patescibacteria group bacterium]|nr:hypothetical protein [Patescibacteria group bacterium]